MTEPQPSWSPIGDNNPPQPSGRPRTTRLMRARDDKWIGGVCGGIAARYGWDSNLVRVVFVASILLPGPQFLLYLLLWLVIPREP